MENQYQHLKYYSENPNSSSSGPASFLCPIKRCEKEGQEVAVDGECGTCGGSSFGVDYHYSCDCGKRYHKECIESPNNIQHHPYHPEHSLKLCALSDFMQYMECICCGRTVKSLLYSCAVCKVCIHEMCMWQPVYFVVDQPKRHDHPLTYFPRQASLICNVCGLVRKHNPTYVCLECNFVAHNDCMFSPRIIRISRHHHRVSFICSLPSGEWSCGVCRQRMENDYGAYTCDKCGDYFVHSRCALRGDICDGEELEGVEDDDITQDAEPFEKLSDGVILHFLHEHHLRLEVSTLYNENKLCHVCVLPIFDGNFYSCMECDFILHESCANSPRRKRHVLHPHPLTLKAVTRQLNGSFGCNACARICGGFVYECSIEECDFDLDVRCASIVEPFDYKGHEHPLFLALHPIERPVCHVCQSICGKQFNCIKCNFIVCLRCATLPYKARYKHDKHFLTLLWGEEVSGNDWCELCERNLGDTSTKLFYWCQNCCTTVHTECLFGDAPYLKPGQFFVLGGKRIQILRKSNTSRPFCDACTKPCQNKIFSVDNRIACSLRCAFNAFDLFKLSRVM